MTDTPNTDVLSEARAREVLATEFERSDRLSHAAFVRSGVSNPDLDDVVRAMQAFAKEANPPASDAAVPARSWTPHTGGSCPVDQDAIVDTITRSGATNTMRAGGVIWRYGSMIYEVMEPMPADAEVVFYRLATAPKVASDTMREADAEVQRILAMSDDEIIAEATAEDAAWARAFKQGLKAGQSAATLSVRSNGEVLEQAAGVADRHAKMGEPIMEPAAYRKASEAIAAEIRALNTNREDAQS